MKFRYWYEANACRCSEDARLQAEKDRQDPSGGPKPAEHDHGQLYLIIKAKTPELALKVGLRKAMKISKVPSKQILFERLRRIDDAKRPKKCSRFIAAIYVGGD
jgi:hypothetical protein